MMNNNSIALYLIWVVNTIYVAGLVPQIILNYRLKTVRGLSDLMLLGYMLGYTTQMFYVFCLKFPLSYLVMTPLGTLAAFVVVTQRFMYNHNRWSNSLVAAYIVLLIGAIAVIPFGWHYPIKIGHAAGWFATVMWTVYQIPQVLKVQLNKSVEGFSFSFVAIGAIGATIELIAALMLGLPLQTIITSARGIIFFFVFCAQFWFFRKTIR